MLPSYRLATCSLFACLALSCGGDDPAPSGGVQPYQRLEFELASPSPPAKTAVLATLRPTGEQSPWAAEAPEVSAGTVPRADGKRVDATLMIGKDQLKFVRAAIPEGARHFNQVIVEVAVRNGAKDKLKLYAFEEGERLFEPKLTEVYSEPQLQAVTFNLNELRVNGRVPDEIGVSLDGKCNFGAIASITFTDVPSESLAPKAEGPGASARIGTLVRRSYGLLPERDLLTRCVVGEGSEFQMFLGLDPRLTVGYSEVQVHLTVSSEAGEKTQSFQVVQDEWKSVTVPAEWLGLGDVSLSLSVDAGDGVGQCVVLVGEPAIRSPRSGETPLRDHETVLLITSDTHRADHIGIVAGDGFVSTPHIDALARRGILFENCMSQTNVTAPSHIALLTGMHVRDTGILTNRDRLAGSVTTLAEAFASAGYETYAATSVLHLGEERSGLGQGFDRADNPPDDARNGEEAISKLATWIEDAGDTPLFCWLHIYDAHTPYSPPKDLDRKYWSGGDPFQGETGAVTEAVIPGWLKGLKDFEFPAAQYRAEVDYVDGMLERVLDLPRVQKGVVAFTADHGETFGEQGIWWSHSTLHPSVTHIPLIMSWPGAPEGKRVDAPVRLMDVGRTLLERCGIESDFGGNDLAEVVEQTPPPSPRYSLAAHHFSAAIELDGWMYLLWLRPHSTSSLEELHPVGWSELYNLRDDPKALNNVLLSEVDRAAKLRSALIEWLDSAPKEQLIEDQERDEAGEAVLAQLGYGDGGKSEAGVTYWNPARYGGKAWQTSPWRRLFEDEAFGPEEFLRAMKR